MNGTLEGLLCKLHCQRMHSVRELGVLMYLARCGGRAEFWAVERVSGTVPHLIARALDNMEVNGLVRLTRVTRAAGGAPMIDLVELAEPGWDRVTEFSAVIIAEIERAAERRRWPFAKPGSAPSGVVDLADLNERFQAAITSADQVNATNWRKRA